MQSNQGKVSGPKQVGLNRQTLVINQVPPLHSRPEQERSTKGKRQKPPSRESTDFRVPKRLDSQVDADAAREQTDGKQDRNMKNIPGRRPANALPRVEQVGDDEYRED